MFIQFNSSTNNTKVFPIINKKGSMKLDRILHGLLLDFFRNWNDDIFIMYMPVENFITFLRPRDKAKDIWILHLVERINWNGIFFCLLYVYLPIKCFQGKLLWKKPSVLSGKLRREIVCLDRKSIEWFYKHFLWWWKRKWVLFCVGKILWHILWINCFYCSQKVYFLERMLKANVSP